MKKASTFLLVAFLMLAINFSAKAQISGTVFKDFDNDGLFDNIATTFPYEKGAANVVVNVYNTGNVLLATATTSPTGAYSFTVGAVPAGNYRIEFITPTGLQNGKGSNTAAASSNTDIQFITAPATLVNYGVASGEWYVTNNNPFIATNVISAGNPSVAGTSATRDNLFVLPYSLPATGAAGAFDPAQAQREAHSSLGSVFGLTYQKSTNTLLNSAYYKRHVSFGPSGIDAIYKTQVTTGNPAVPSLLVKLSTIGINVGTDTRSATVGDVNYIPPASNGTSQDQAAFANIAKRGIGDIDLSEDGKNLFVVNLFENKLHRINVGAPLKTSFVAGDVTTWVIPNPTGIGSLTWHPFGLKTAYGKVYVGGVVVKEQTTNHNLATDTAGQRGVVYELDPATGVFTEVLRFPLTYRRGFANSDTRFPFRNNYWCAWQNNGDGSATGPLQNGYNTGFAAVFNGGTTYPQPMLADIEFTDDNQMLIGMRDRFGDQMGYQQPDINGFPGATGFGGTAGIQYRALASGDNLIAGKDLAGAGWTLENRAQATNYGVVTGTADGIYPFGTQTIATTTNWTTNTGTPYGIGGVGTSGAYGPGSGFGVSTYTSPGGPAPGNNQGGYYLNNHNFSADAANSGEDGLNGAVTLNGAATAITAHFNKGDGGMAVLRGSNEYIFTLMDPVNATFTSGLERMVVNTNGAAINGNMVQRLELSSFVANDPSNMGKANAMGDVEVLTPYQPIEVGNRIWNDTNGDGLQGAGEAGINGVAVELVSPGLDGIFGNADDVIVATATTATVAGQAGSYFFNTLTTEDTRKATANLPGVPALNILPGFNYQVRVANAVGASKQAALASYQPTSSNASSNSLDKIDNDGIISGNNVIAIFNTNDNNHSFDFGFKQLASLGDKVWLDEGAGGGTRNNGLQDGTEPGVAGVGVNLYQNGADGLPNTADDVIVASTITDAFGMYMFENLTPTDQTSAATIAATSYFIRVSPPANYSPTVQTNTTDDNSTTAPSTTGSDVNVLGQSYGINLSAGENNPNIDAGLIFKPQAIPNSIGDKVWFDADGDGINDGGATEPGVAGVTVTLYKETSAGSGVFEVYMTTTTDATGNYLFNNVPAGTNFQVGFGAPAGTVLTTGGTLDIANGSTNSDPSPTTGRTTTFSSGAAGTQITGVDAGLRNDAKGAIGDFVWNDLDRDGLQDAGEPGVAGVLMTLYNVGADGIRGNGDDGTTLTTTTDANGYYVFPNLDPSKYIVAATPVVGYTLSPKDVTAANPGGDSKDSDFGAGTGFFAGSYVSPVKELKPIAGGVTRDMTIDVGIYSNAAVNTLNTLGDKVWNDVNKDGIQDAGEAGVPNVTVRLLNNLGNPVNNPATGKPYVVTTDANGNYKFVDLVDGNYIVEFANLPAGFVFTGADALAGTDATDSDANTTTGRTGLISVDATSASATSVNITNVDAGITQGIPAGTASLGNRVWYDNGRDATGAIVPANRNNGLQDAGELGVNNVKVELLDAAGNPVNVPSTAIPYVIYTNALGEYLFTGLPAGDYRVRFSGLPSGFTYSAANQGADDTKDSDGAAIGTTTATTSTTGTYTLQTGEDNVTVDLGIVPPATGNNNSIGNFVWSDIDADGIQDAGEPGVQGVTVTLYTNGADGVPGTADDVRVGVTTTDNNGAYSFVGLADGNYNVGFTNLPAGFSFTDKDKAGSTATDGSDANTASGRTGTFALDPTSASATGINEITVDGGLITTKAALGNFVWLDTDGDGVQDATEKGVAGVTVTLYGIDGTTVLASTITDADGKYYFGNLMANSYRVGFSTIPSNLTFTQQNAAGDNQNNTNSDAVPATATAITALTGVITLVAGETDLSVDAGLKPNNDASVGNLVWNDLDGDGIQDTNEPGVPGILVTLYDASNNVIGTAVTDGNGNYLISKIPAGTGYYIVFSNLPGTAIFTSQTSDVSAGDATNGSDANTLAGPNFGRTASFNLTAGQYLPTVDAGIRNVQVLPIKIESFTAIPKGSQVNLQWKVSEQTNVATYEVEASADGRTFATIATLSSNGNQGATYDAVHTTPIAGINYYRIKTIEKDGTISYSDIRKVNFGKGGDVIVYPNPVSTGVVNITLTGNMINKAATISILSMEGKLISQQQIAKTSQTETINVSTLANGSYIVRLVTENEVINKTIQVIR
jgi:SdrD B-like domain/Secretion system C-terminal sorting domain